MGYPFLKIFDVIPGWVYAAALAVVMVASGWQIVSLRLDLGRAATTLATERQERAEEDLARSQAARYATQEYRRIENKRASQAQEIANADLEEKRLTSERLARGRAADDGLSGNIKAFAAGSGGAAEDSAALADSRQRAATLGSLLESCRREATEDAGELEGLATQVRGLQRSYNSLMEGGHEKSNPGAGASDGGRDDGARAGSGGGA